MIEKLLIPTVLNGKPCKIHVLRTLFSNDEDTVSLIEAEGEKYNYNDLSVADKNAIVQKIEDFDKEQVKKGL